MQSMKKLLKRENSVSLLECGDSQFHAALSMEARTRSPLPPSPTTSTSAHDIETQFSSLSDLSEKFAQRFPSKSSNNLLLNRQFEQPGFPRFKPLKPPRKNLYSKDNDLNTGEYETVNKYDEVECRNEAWKQLGTSEINHTENIQDEEEEEYMSWGGKREPLIEQAPPKATKIITQISSDDSYDTLEFFGSSNKLNVHKSGYKQVYPIPINVLPTPPPYNDYDEVGEVLEGVRLADDSHLGYGLIRKNTKEPVDHKLFNNEPYAVISKPKRV